MDTQRGFVGVRNKLLLGHFFVAMALNTTMPLYPFLQRSLGLSVLQTAVLPTVLTLTTTIANLFAGVLIARIGQKTLLLCSYALMALANFALFFASDFGSIALTFVLLGVGVGWAFTSMATVYSHLPSDLQNFGVYHALFGLGGLTSPALLNQTVNLGFGYQWLFLAYSAVLTGMFFAYFFDGNLKNQKFRDLSLKGMLGVLRTPLVVLSLLAFAAYAAVEIGTSNLSGLMMVLGYGRSELFAGNVLILFWFSFTVTRFVSDALAARLGALRLPALSAVLGFIAVLLWSLGLSPWLFVAAGAAFGPVFPVIQKYANSRLQADQRGLFNGMTYALTGLGAGLTMPIMGRLGDIRIELAFIPTMILLVILLVLVIVIPRLAWKTSPDHPGIAT